MVRKIYPEKLPAKPEGWTIKELASFFRVRTGTVHTWLSGIKMRKIPDAKRVRITRVRTDDRFVVTAKK